MSENQIIKKGGVKTDEGKSVSKYNAQKHSILRDLPTAYESIEIEELYKELVADLKPKGRMQEILVEVIALNTVKLCRVVKSESEHIKMSLSPYIKAEFEVTVFKPAHHEYKIQMDLTDRKFQILARYQTAMENRIYKALSALKILQNEQS